MVAALKGHFAVIQYLVRYAADRLDVNQQNAVPSRPLVFI